MAIFDRNVEALSKKQKYLKDKLLNHEYQQVDAIAIKEEVAKDGTPILILDVEENSYAMNSKYRPLDEAKKFASQFQQIKDYAVELVFGFGNGYFPREIMKQGSSLVRYAFFEPCMESFLYVMKHYDISDILGNDKVVIFVNGINELEIGAYLPEMVEWVNLPLMDIVSLPRYKDLFIKEYERFLMNGREVSARVQMGMNTWITFAQDRMVNELHHLQYVTRSNSIDDFSGVFPKGMGAILVSAGPSLAKNIELLKDCKGKFLIVCVDTAVKKLFEYDIIPDVIIGVDSQKCKAYVEGYEEKYKDVMYVQKLDATYAMLLLCPCKRIAFIQADKDYVYHIYHDYHHSLSDLATGGSVANTAFSMLEFWGIQTIILVGQDLALTGGKRYADDTVDAVIKSEEDGWQIYEVDGYCGEKVKTRDDYFSYLGWFEGAAAISPAKIINATEGGACIHGVEQLTLKESLDRYGMDVNIQEILANVPVAFNQEQQKEIQARIHGYEARLNILITRFKEGQALAKKGQMLIRTPGYSKGELAAIDKKLDILDQECKKYQELDMVAARACEVERRIARDRVVDLEGKFKDTGAVLQSILDIYEAYEDAGEKLLWRLKYVVSELDEKGAF